MGNGVFVTHKRAAPVLEASQTATTSIRSAAERQSRTSCKISENFEMAAKEAKEILFFKLSRKNERKKKKNNCNLISKQSAVGTGRGAHSHTGR